ncbi:hypothetical protein IU427_26735 [Nocardia beijingensis]|uniref:hypothetical protein n=1 Tax=Nocardia beijingensis TaxID=95162 RepID=UPI00189379D7|nr:hypothetical protein [Nocardia beijingensis]MBF6468733.1 hypothetical protein [Nocardia beijingensis]
MNHPYDAANDEGTRETSDDREKDVLEGGSEAPGDLAGPGPGDGRKEDPDT